MDHPRHSQFSDAAIRTDPRPLRSDLPPEPSPVVEERVLSDRGVVAYEQPPVVERPLVHEAAPIEERRRFSLGATFLGWSVAAFFTVVFSAIAIAVLGGATLDGAFDLNALALGSLVAYLLVAFAAYMIGGYAAGRIALWDGVLHGMLTVAWAVLFAIAALVAGSAFADTFGLNVVINIDPSTLTTGAVVAVIATLVAMLAGAGLGGLLGERYHDRVHGYDRERRVSSRTRGRPL